MTSRKKSPKSVPIKDDVHKELVMEKIRRDKDENLKDIVDEILCKALKVKRK